MTPKPNAILGYLVYTKIICGTAPMQHVFSDPVVRCHAIACSLWRVVGFAYYVDAFVKRPQLLNNALAKSCVSGSSNANDQQRSTVDHPLRCFFWV